MDFIQIKTHFFTPPKDNIYTFFDRYLPPLENKDILLIASKLISIHQGLCVRKEKELTVRSLAIPDSDAYLPSSNPFISIKHHTFLLNAGIDPFHDFYLFLPQKPCKIAREIYSYLKKKFRISQCGVLIVDSHSIPLRRGKTGYCVGFFGIHPLKDLSSVKPYVTKRSGWPVNIVDALAAVGGIYLGESSKQMTPLVLIRGADFVEFSKQDHSSDFFLTEKEDRYASLYKHFVKNK